MISTTIYTKGKIIKYINGNPFLKNKSPPIYLNNLNYAKVTN
jgi:hypothetical protein